MASYKGLRRDGSAVNCKLVCFAIFTAPSHCWLTVTLWPNCTRKDLIFVLFPGDSSQLIAEIPVFTPCRHYTISPYHISHVMFYYALIMTSHVVIRHSSVSTGSAPKCHPPREPHWQIPLLSQGWRAAVPWGSAWAASIHPADCQHKASHCPPFGLCLTVFILFC